MGDFSSASGELFDFEILPTPNGTTFDLSASSKQALIRSMREYNKKVKRALREGNTLGVSKAHGYSSGCPVVHNMPRFSQSDQDQERIEELGNYLEISPKKITEHREQTAINKGMFAVSRLIARAVKLSPDNEIITGEKAA